MDVTSRSERSRNEMGGINYYTVHFHDILVGFPTDGVEMGVFGWMDYRYSTTGNLQRDEQH